MKSEAGRKKHDHVPTHTQSLIPSLLDFCIQAILEAPADSTPTVTYTLCDVRDVAKAHVLAAETQSASGRYIVSNAKRLDAHDITQILKVCFQVSDLVQCNYAVLCLAVLSLRFCLARASVSQTVSIGLGLLLSVICSQRCMSVTAVPFA